MRNRRKFPTEEVAIKRGKYLSFEEQRDIIKNIFDESLTRKEAKERFNINDNTISRWTKKYGVVFPFSEMDADGNILKTRKSVYKRVLFPDRKFVHYNDEIETIKKNYKYFSAGEIAKIMGKSNIEVGVAIFGKRYYGFLAAQKANSMARAEKAKQAAAARKKQEDEEEGNSASPSP